MVLQPGDQIERDVGDNKLKSQRDLTSKKQIKKTAEDVEGNFSSIESISKELHIPLKVFDHIKTHGKDSLHRQGVLAHDLHVSSNVVSKRIKILLIILWVVGAGKAIQVGAHSFWKSDKVENVDKNNYVPINLQDLAWYDQTKLTWLMWALVDASDSKVFSQDIMLDLDETYENSHRKVNFKKNLQKLREYKFHKKPNARKLAAMSGVYKKMVEPLIESKEGFTSYSLDEWRKDMDHTIDQINKNIDRDKVCKLTWVKLSHKDIVEDIFSRMGSDHILSYTCTELFGDLPWEFSINYLNYLFTHGGEEYVYHIPAVYDNMASFGPYQLTSSVVRHDDDAMWSANVMQQALPGKYQTIPWSMYKLTPQNQNEATYLNMIYNMCIVINHLQRNKHLEAQLDHFKNKDIKVILQILAVSHNSPLQAIRATKNRCKDGMGKPYASYVKWGKAIYAQRTEKFYNATQTYRPKH